ncbi:MAG: leucyl/phenylalanyl-tRNA--protein transferase [Bacteroidota bacterium]
MPVFLLEEELLEFPPVHLAESDGLLAVGGDLSINRLLLAYHHGIFPWYSADEPILWYCPKNRFVIYPSTFHASKSLQKIYNKGTYTYTISQHFDAVIQFCSQINRKDQEGTWITDDMITAYCTLFNEGYALSVEVWNENNQLVGGLYGVKLNRFFAGESMFSIESNTSKLAMYHLIQQDMIDLIDCQFHTDHLESLGGTYIPLKTYLSTLNKLVK